MTTGRPLLAIGGSTADVSRDELAAFVRDGPLVGMTADPELAANLAAVAHLIHDSSEGRFSVTYAPGPELSRADVEGVGFNYLPLDEALERFPPATVDIPDPGLGLWRT